MHDRANGGWRNMDGKIDTNHPKNKKNRNIFCISKKKSVPLRGEMLA
jgi:hypothetical protein